MALRLGGRPRRAMNARARCGQRSKAAPPHRRTMRTSGSSRSVCGTSQRQRGTCAAEAPRPAVSSLCPCGAGARDGYAASSQPTPRLVPHTLPLALQCVLLAAWSRLRFAVGHGMGESGRTSSADCARQQCAGTKGRAAPAFALRCLGQLTAAASACTPPSRGTPMHSCPHAHALGVCAARSSPPSALCTESLYDGGRRKEGPLRTHWVSPADAATTAESSAPAPKAARVVPSTAP